MGTSLFFIHGSFRCCQQNSAKICFTGSSITSNVLYLTFFKSRLSFPDLCVRLPSTACITPPPQTQAKTPWSELPVSPRHLRRMFWWCSRWWYIPYWDRTFCRPWQDLKLPAADSVHSDHNRPGMLRWRRIISLYQDRHSPHSHPLFDPVLVLFLIPFFSDSRLKRALFTSIFFTWKNTPIIPSISSKYDRTQTNTGAQLANFLRGWIGYLHVRKALSGRLCGREFPGNQCITGPLKEQYKRYFPNEWMDKTH